MIIPREQNGTSREHHNHGTHNYTAPTLPISKYRIRDIQKFNIYTQYIILKTRSYFFIYLACAQLLMAEISAPNFDTYFLNILTVNSISVYIPLLNNDG